MFLLSHSERSVLVHYDFLVAGYVLLVVQYLMVSKVHPNDAMQSIYLIVIGNPLMLSPDFPPP